MLLHGRVLPPYDVRLSVCPSGVTLMDCDHISWAKKVKVKLGYIIVRSKA